MLESLLGRPWRNRNSRWSQRNSVEQFKEYTLQVGDEAYKRLLKNVENNNVGMEIGRL